MRRLLAGVMAAAALLVLTAVPVEAQDEPVRGSVSSDPAAVPAAGEYMLTASGSGFIADSAIILAKCVVPGDPFVPGVTESHEITERALGMDPLVDCDLASAVAVEVDGAGNWTAELTAEIGDNFMLSAGALDGSQAGATWVPIVSDLPETGSQSLLLTVFGVAVVAAGAIFVTEARRIRRS